MNAVYPHEAMHHGAPLVTERSTLSVAQAVTTDVEHQRHGQRVGPCTLLGLLAEGTHGRLYRARRVDTGLRMVVQFLSAPEADRYDLRRTPIQHPNLWPLQGQGQHAGQCYLLMPELNAPALLDGDASPARSLHEALKLMLQVSDAVSSLHRLGWLHLRLSAANIRVVGGQAIIMDHGTSRYLHGRSSVAWTGLAPQSAYLAPEQIEPGARVGKHTDVYAIGALLLAAITGQSPDVFDGLPADQWRTRAPLVPSAVLQICARALQLEPSQRYADASALALDLRQYCQRIRPRSQRAAWSDRVWVSLRRAFGQGR